MNVDRSQFRMAGAWLAVAAVFATFTVFAAGGWGLAAGGIFLGAVFVGAAGPPMAILLFRDGLPLKGVIATGLAVAAQVAFRSGALVRRDDGRYEWTVLREDEDGLFAELEDGRRVPIDADRGDLFQFGFAPLAITEQKTERNMDAWTVVETPGDSQQPVEHRAGEPVLPPRRNSDGWLVSLATIQRAIRGSATSTLVRRGRDKALDDEGGMQALSPLWTMAFATVLLLVGFGMTAGAMML